MKTVEGTVWGKCRDCFLSISLQDDQTVTGGKFKQVMVQDFVMLHRNTHWTLTLVTILDDLFRSLSYFDFTIKNKKMATFNSSHQFCVLHKSVRCLNRYGMVFLRRMCDQ